MGMQYSFSRDIWRGIVRYSFEKGKWSLWPSDAVNMPPEECRKFDGVIGLFGNNSGPQRLQSLGLKVVNVSNRGFDIPSVLNDDFTIGVMAADYFMNKGFQKFIFFGQTSIRYSTLRGEGFAHRLAQRNQHCQVFHPNYQGREPMEWLNDVPVSTAIFCSDDVLAFRLMQTCIERDIPVPQHVAILGCDNDETFCLSGTIGMSTILLASERLGYTAAELLDGMFKGQQAPSEPILIPPLSVISRISTDMQSVRDELVRKALRYIQNNVHRNLQVSDLLKHLNVSRRTLERRFQSKLGHSPHHAINRVRVEMAKRLLEATEMKMDDIAQNCGFSEARILYRNFRMITGVSPAKYRKNFM